MVDKQKHPLDKKRGTDQRYYQRENPKRSIKCKT